MECGPPPTKNNVARFFLLEVMEGEKVKWSEVPPPNKRQWGKVLLYAGNIGEDGKVEWGALPPAKDNGARYFFLQIMEGKVGK